MEYADASRSFRAIMEWLRIPPEQIRFIHKPTLFRELRVAAQAEFLDGPRTVNEYLDLVEDRIAGNLPEIEPKGIVFVARTLMPREQGFSAGEVYLVSCLRQLGIEVIHPERMPLIEQMKTYAGAKHLIFSEGSAIHGRQLLGRIDQNIAILRRRFRSFVAYGQLEPRCTTLTYIGCFQGALSIVGPEGSTVQHAMCSQYNMEPVFDHFEALGVPLRSVWNWGEYCRMRDEDVISWVRTLYSPNVSPWLRPQNSDEQLLAQLEPQNLGHLREEVIALIHALRGTQPAPQPVAAPAIIPKRENAADILCIGSQRAATTWAHRVLAAHPAVAPFADFSPLTDGRKGVHYWDRNHKRGPDWYRAVLRPANDTQRSLDVSPSYALLGPAQIAECKALNPTARVIAMLRDPLAQAVSMIRAHVMAATNNAQADTRVIRFDDGFRTLCERLRLRDHADAAAQVRRWRVAYPDLMILASETIAPDPGLAARRLLESAGLSMDGLTMAEQALFETVARRVERPSLPYRFESDCLYFLHGMLAPARDAVAAEMGLRFTEGEALLNAMA
ncbi:MAG: glycosyltransferase 61 family protein [Paracoccaceae bacterium]